MKWKLAQILEVRYEVPYDDDAVFWDPEDSTAEVPSTTAVKAENGTIDQTKEAKTLLVATNGVEESKQG